jgi:hypothetical protein
MKTGSLGSFLLISFGSALDFGGRLCWICERLVQNGVFVIAEKFATQLTEEYLAETSILNRSKNDIDFTLSSL